MNSIAIQPDPKTVLAQAVFKAADQLGLSKTQLASVIGWELNTIQQIENSAKLDPSSPQGESALLLIRLYQGLSAQMSDDPEWISNFMNTFNTASGDIPVQQIQTREGLVKVLNIVEAIKNR
ncbi:antitoxin Xre-like helix-turn-helix domain-containing protein [Acinetobacter sp. A47]|uniref:antitoxin Xre-like helix-turn-helix domain-containing protein n=1 Tax=Acinetobacter sp. A47 TaxID=1561217 RepID=UPI0005705585|nr:antitoxin Xre-like helix-turn-helix domain-containing protein [Acinetobacter sp. A47]